MKKRDLVVVSYGACVLLFALAVAAWKSGGFIVGADGSKSGWLFNFQTLIAGVLAIFAAVIGGLFVLNQTNSVERREGARLERVAVAARAVLPLALSAVSQYAENAARGLAHLLTISAGQRIPATIYVAPAIDGEAIPALRDMIENAAPKIGDRIALMISDIQVMSSRLEALQNNLTIGSTSIIVVSNINEYIIGAGVIYARSSSLFEYGRRQSDEVPPTYPTEDSLLGALRLLGLDDSTHPEIFDTASKRARVKAANLH